jgi:SAM-dependent methyltransferase
MTHPDTDPRHPLYLIRRYLREALERHRGVFRGRVLDIGCGRQPYRGLVEAAGGAYVGLDLPRPGTVADLYGSALDLPFPAGSFEAVLCTEVLEHLPVPQRCLTEVARVLTAGGHLVMTTPWLWGPHEVPHDYFRYTEHGLRHLAESAGLKVLAVQKTCGIAAALGQRLSAGVHHRLGKGWAAQVVLGRVYAAIHALSDWFDRKAARRGEPLGYVLVATKGRAVPRGTCEGINER